MEHFSAIKTNDNLYNQNSRIIVYINNEYHINEFTEIFIDKCNYLYLKIDNYIKYEIIAVHRSSSNNFNDFISSFKQITSKINSNWLIVVGNLNINISNDSNGQW